MQKLPHITVSSSPRLDWVRLQAVLTKLMAPQGVVEDRHIWPPASAARHTPCTPSFAAESSAARWISPASWSLTAPSHHQQRYHHRQQQQQHKIMTRNSVMTSYCHFETGQGPCSADMHQWGLAKSPSCDCGQRQTTNHIVNTCTKFEGGLNLLHEVDDAVIWLESTATAAHTHTHAHLTVLFPGLPRWAGTRKVKPIWILLKQETVSGSSIS